ncbi:hypothetical protein ACFQ23_08145 [Schaalia naturae]|uniref:Uncharacterized protein n=1 Tax=Schaalia naturae TaxID=635203 RepID=A0ABW2SR22_9ACTO
MITFLMLHGGLRPGYDYLLSRKLSPLWREIQTSPLRAEIDGFLDEAEQLGFTARTRRWGRCRPNVRGVARRSSARARP